MTATKTLIALSLTLAGTAFAKGSSHVQSGTEPVGSMVPIELAQRIVRYPWDRLKQTADGDILTCPLWWEAEYNRGDLRCIDPTTKVNRWIPLSQVELPGFEKSGVQLTFTGSGGYMTLVVYFRKKQ